MTRKPLLFLRDILSAIERIESYTRNGKEELVGWVARSKTQQLIIKAIIDLCNIVEPKVQAVAIFSL